MTGLFQLSTVNENLDQMVNENRAQEACDENRHNVNYQKCSMENDEILKEFTDKCHTKDTKILQTPVLK